MVVPLGFNFSGGISFSEFHLFFSVLRAKITVVINLVKDYINDYVSFLTDLSFFLSKKITVSIIINCVLSESNFVFTFGHFKKIKNKR
ncbi:hypothetical protein LBMAG27_22000 [Bacteroidota bacterium]|nr:hypothetical protein LBMAG27_22000 [Bacteroidota bacterium]